ncbi:variable surface lipoprotein [Mycoplasma sp. OR1901]|uniref:variable surface lipoprotein n=1 Tax=Mycoplasma sp. OR1901 TaxID=2742195 RepID=UPI001581C772|nr:variable surface lipoprotein [Mycoplasma sp. OR1901]QKT05416.1 hypothetical protein HTZ87_01725 [Mycoplasma sp. OR1901]
MKLKINKLLLTLGSLASLNLIALSCTNTESKTKELENNNKQDNQGENNPINQTPKKENITKTDEIEGEKNQENNTSQSNEPNKENTSDAAADIDTNTPKENQEDTNNISQDSSSNRETQDDTNKETDEKQLDEHDLYWLRKKHNDNIDGLFQKFEINYISNTLNDWLIDKKGDINQNEAKINNFKNKLNEQKKEFIISLETSKHTKTELDKLFQNAIQEVLKVTNEIVKEIKESDNHDKNYLNTIYNGKNEKQITLYNLFYLYTLGNEFKNSFDNHSMILNKEQWYTKLKEKVESVSSIISNEKSLNEEVNKTLDLMLAATTEAKK